MSCLHRFTMAEMLTGNNKFGCDTCTKRQKTSQDSKTEGEEDNIRNNIY